MSFTFPVDANAKAGAVKAVGSGNAFVVPVQLQSGEDGITPVTESSPLPVAGEVSINQETDGTTNKVVATGKAAHDAAASGNPVQVGGVYRATDPAVGDGDAASLRVNTKGEAIVQVSGSNAVEDITVRLHETLITRALKTASEGVSLTPPSGAKGCIVSLGVFGMTGTFSEGQGVYCRLYHYTASSGHNIGVSTTIKSVIGNHEIYWYPGAITGDLAAATTNAVVKIAGVPLPLGSTTGDLRFSIYITGSFGAGEGIDLSAYIDWIY